MLKTQSDNRQSEYHAVNLLIVASIASILLVVRFDLLHFECVYHNIGATCKTCGLTTAFKSILWLKTYNIRPEFLFLFIAFASQLILRPAVSYLLYHSSKFELIKHIDIIVSCILFAACYLYTGLS